MRPIVGLLPAAGAGRRFGGDKLLARLPDGRTVGEAAAGNLIAGVDRAIAVVRAEDAALTERLRTAGLKIVVNPRADAGIGTSIGCGVAAGDGAAGWLIALADMPWIAPATIAAVGQALRDGASIAAPIHHGRRGHPVGFSRCWETALVELRGDRGARDLLARHAEEVVGIEAADPGILRDIDRPADLGRSSDRS